MNRESITQLAGVAAACAANERYQVKAKLKAKARASTLGRATRRRTRFAAIIPFLATLITLLSAGPGFTQVKMRTVTLNDFNAMQLRNVKAERVTYKGRKALRVSDAAAANVPDGIQLVILNKTKFQDGVIRIDLTGEPSATAGEGARGFVGVAFRVNLDVAKDTVKYECFYLRPTNGRADDQVRRNHSTQYVSYPDFPWYRLRKEFPEKYESYVDVVPGEWTKMRIEVRGDKARLYVNDISQPVLVVNDLKQGPGQGQIALWVGAGTVAHFSNLRYQSKRPMVPSSK